MFLTSPFGFASSRNPYSFDHDVAFVLYKAAAAGRLSGTGSCSGSMPPDASGRALRALDRRLLVLLGYYSRAGRDVPVARADRGLLVGFPLR